MPKQETEMNEEEEVKAMDQEEKKSVALKDGNAASCVSLRRNPSIGRPNFDCPSFQARIGAIKAPQGNITAPLFSSSRSSHLRFYSSS